MDRRVVPGFRYRVRRAGRRHLGKFFYGGEAKTLESVGMGYGKRLTFTGDSLNNNDCFFWSDSEPNGFAFSVSAVEAGARLAVVGLDDCQLGEATVTAVLEPQEETAMTTDPKEGVSKAVAVRLALDVTYFHRHHHGLMDMVANQDSAVVTGLATVTRGPRARLATLRQIGDVFLPRLGQVTLVPDL